MGISSDSAKSAGSNQKPHLISPTLSSLKTQHLFWDERNIEITALTGPVRFYEHIYNKRNDIFRFSFWWKKYFSKILFRIGIKHTNRSHLQQTLCVIPRRLTFCSFKRCVICPFWVINTFWDSAGIRGDRKLPRLRPALHLVRNHSETPPPFCPGINRTKTVLCLPRRLFSYHKENRWKKRVAALILPPTSLHTPPPPRPRLWQCHPHMHWPDTDCLERSIQPAPSRCDHATRAGGFHCEDSTVWSFCPKILMPTEHLLCPFYGTTEKLRKHENSLAWLWPQSEVRMNWVSTACQPFTRFLAVLTDERKK